MATSSGIGSVVVEGLSEATEAKRAMALKLAELQRAKKQQASAGKERDKKIAKLTLLRDTKNPQIVVESLREANEGELVNGKAAKGWVVEISCACCEEHKDEARKEAGKVRRASAKVAKLEALDEAELAKQIEALESELAA